MDSTVTNFMIICDSMMDITLMRSKLATLIGVNKLNLRSDILITLYPKNYRCRDGLRCDYFAVFTSDTNEYFEWKRRLEPHGKELRGLTALVNKIKETISLKEFDSQMNAIQKYMDIDIAATRSAYERRNELNNTIINVIFNDPATIVFWYDGTKTVVKAQGDDIFDPEKGLAMAIAKKFMGNKGNYCNELKKWLPKEEKEEKTDEEFDLYAFDRMIRKKIADALTISLDEEPEHSTNKWYKKVKESLGIEAKDE